MRDRPCGDANRVSIALEVAVGALEARSAAGELRKVDALAAIDLARELKRNVTRENVQV